jgi:hypothetical protein
MDEDGGVLRQWRFDVLQGRLVEVVEPAPLPQTDRGMPDIPVPEAVPWPRLNNPTVQRDQVSHVNYILCVKSRRCSVSFLDNVDVHEQVLAPLRGVCDAITNSPGAFAALLVLLLTLAHFWQWWLHAQV